MSSSARSAAEADDDPELREGPRQDLHSVRARDPALDALSEEVQRNAAKQAAADFMQKATADLGRLRSMLGNKPVLVTGSAGYLGVALYLTLKELGISVFGIDVVFGPTVDKMVDVSDSEAMRRCGQDCGAVLHCAALHAPHALSWHAREFRATNVDGTRHVLALCLPTVHTSTTSLTITPRVKRREARGELVWLDESAQRPDRADGTGGADGKLEDGGGRQGYDPSIDAPRNKYGRTKLEAEQLCLAAAAAAAAAEKAEEEERLATSPPFSLPSSRGPRGGCDVVVLRAPRFFPEDVLEENGSRSLPNIKCNELLGRRCALVDLVDAHLRALARLPQLRGRVLTVAAPLPLEGARVVCARGGGCGREPAGSRGAPAAFTSPEEVMAQVRERLPHAERLYKKHGWRLPEAITRVYDCQAAIEALGWRPRVTFEAVLRIMEQNEEAAPRPGSQDKDAATEDPSMAAVAGGENEERPCKQSKITPSAHYLSHHLTLRQVLRGVF